MKPTTDGIFLFPTQNLAVEFETRDALWKTLKIQVTDAGKFVSQERRFDWALLVEEDDLWMRRVCMTRRVVDGVEPWVVVDDQYKGRGWKVYAGGIFPKKCSACTRGNLCEAMELDFDVDAMRDMARGHSSAKTDREKELRNAKRNRSLPTDGPSSQPTPEAGAPKPSG